MAASVECVAGYRAALTTLHMLSTLVEGGAQWPESSSSARSSRRVVTKLGAFFQLLKERFVEVGERTWSLRQTFVPIDSDSIGGLKAR